MNKRRNSIVKSTIIEKMEIVAGWIIIFMILLVLMGLFVSNSIRIYEIITVVLFLSIGIGFIVVGNNRKKFRLSFQEYVKIVSNEPVGSIRRIATQKGVSFNECKNQLQDMIDKRFFENAYINEEGDRIIIPISSFNKIDKDELRINKNEAYVTCFCPKCKGVNLKIKKRQTKCDFCGFIIK